VLRRALLQRPAPGGGADHRSEGRRDAPAAHREGSRDASRPARLEISSADAWGSLVGRFPQRPFRGGACPQMSATDPLRTSVRRHLAGSLQAMDHRALRCEITSDPAVFWDRVSAFLLAEPVLNTILITNVDSRRRGLRVDPARPTFVA